MARDGKSANDAKTAVESLAATWPETVSDGKQQIIEARNEAVTAIQDKQAAAVLAVRRASQTTQQNIASAQSTAVQAVQAAQTGQRRPPDARRSNGWEVVPYGRYRPERV